MHKHFFSGWTCCRSGNFNVLYKWIECMIDFKEVENTRKFIAGGAFLWSSSKRFPNAEEVYLLFKKYILHTFNFLCLSLKNNTQNKKLKSIILKSMFIFENPKGIALFLRQRAKIYAKDLWKLKWFLWLESGMRSISMVVRKLGISTYK